MLNRLKASVPIAFLLLIAWAFSAPPPTPAPAARPAPSRYLPPPAAQPPPDGTRRPRRKRLLVDRHAAPPRRIEIPAIGVSAPVIPLGLHRDGTIQTPTAWGDTGWYKPGPEPGELGAAVVVGHVDSTTGPAAFYRLPALRAGDMIRIRRRDGSIVRFRVQRIEHWPKTDFPSRRVYGPSRGSVLRLVTCSGNFNRSTGHYVDNTIVYASRV
jgi:hypothetical protein